MSVNKIGGKIIKYSALALILLFLLFPVFWVLLTSFKTNMEAYRFPPTFIPKDPSLSAYINLFTKHNDFFVYYKNNFLVSGCTAVFTLFLAVLSGYALSRFHFTWNRWIVAALLTSQMFPVISRMISLYDLMGKVALINTRTGLVLALVAAMVPFTSMLMSGFFESVPRAIEEAAYIDGSGRMGILVRIVMPLVKPGVVAVVIYAFLMAWDDYLHAVTLIQNDALRTLSAGVALRYLGELSYDWSLINSISVVGMLPIIVLFFFFQKYMVKGLVAGAVKG
ncbi:MAG: carbohydrate ABC transporter permease [Treponema sp.]|jgi:multiple sugar transport system permease protein|nr:carbohydrate ABC transporter permease [Treponema sp.]